MNTLTSGLADVWALLFNVLAFIILTAFLFLFANRVGKGSFVALIASFYVGFALYTVFPYAKTFSSGAGTLNAGLVSLVLYLVFTTVSYVILRRSITSGFFLFGSVGTIILSLLTAGFLIALSYHSFSLESIYTFPHVIKTYFAPTQYFFWWFIAPCVGLLALSR